MTDDELLRLAERLGLMLSRKRIRECVASLRSTKDDWTSRSVKDGWHRPAPYPMGFYPDDPNLYYAIGWGSSVHMWPWERWLVRRAAALRAHAKEQSK